MAPPDTAGRTATRSRGKWGIADVEDCVAAARFLVERGSVDPARLAIRGGSAGGYTTLAALTFRPEVFAAGISHFGIADLELIHVDGHKFESRYDEGLVAPWTDEGREVFRERSPIHFLDRVRAPVLLFQGLDDRVVPPSQLDAMVEAFTARGLPHVAMTFEGEGHGFRRAETKRATLPRRARVPGAGRSGSRRRTGSSRWRSRGWTDRRSRRRRRWRRQSCAVVALLARRYARRSAPARPDRRSA